jgi:hypothetical protein
MVLNNAGVLLTPVTCIYEAVHLGGVLVAFTFNCWSESRLCSINKLRVELSGSMVFLGFVLYVSWYRGYHRAGGGFPGGNPIFGEAFTVVKSNY